MPCPTCALCGATTSDIFRSAIGSAPRPGRLDAADRPVGRRGSAGWACWSAYSGRVHLELVTIVVREYDPAIDFFVRTLGFELAEDSPATTNDGRPKRWVVVRPSGGTTGLLLARADGDDQSAVGAGFAAIDRTLGSPAPGRGLLASVPDRAAPVPPFAGRTAPLAARRQPRRGHRPLHARYLLASRPGRPPPLPDGAGRAGPPAARGRAARAQPGDQPAEQPGEPVHVDHSQRAGEALRRNRTTDAAARSWR